MLASHNGHHEHFRIFTKMPLMIFLRLSLLLLVVSLWMGCHISALDALGLPSPIVKISSAPGPEDLALDTFENRHRVILSTAVRRTQKGLPRAGGRIQYLPVPGDTVYTFSITGYMDSIYPHGIDLARWDDTLYLFVISHNATVKDPSDFNRHLILQFRVTDDHLIWKHTWESPFLKAPNDLFVTDDGRIYVSNYLKRISTFQTLWSALFRFRTGSIVYYLPGEGWNKLPGRYGYPNGVYVSRQHLYVAEGTRKRVLRFNLDAAGHPQPAPVTSPKMFLFADNLMPGPEGWLYGTCHPFPLKFKAHAADGTKISPSWLFRIHPDLADWEWIGKDDGSNISAASTCLPYRDTLYVGQVFQPYILKLPFQNHR